MFVVGVTGGIAAGKSVVARRFAELGASLVDADQLAREVVAPGTPGLEAVARRFGAAVLRPDGSLDRAALGDIVFSEPAARRDLEAITHPAVKALSQQRMQEAVADDPTRVVIYDVPLLVEARGSGEFDRVVVVEAPRDVRVERLVRLRGMAEAEAHRRVDSQASDDDRRAVADDIIDSSGSEESTLAQADELYGELRSFAITKAEDPGQSGR